MPRPVTVAIVGIFRSGTNYLRSLLEFNYRTQAVYNAYGWKHGFVPIITKKNALRYPTLPTVMITRNPFSAIDALFRYVTRAGANICCDTQWHPFLRRRFVVHDKWNEDSPQLWFPNPVHYWTAMNWNYLSAGSQHRPVCHVRYEDLISDPQAETQRIAALFSLERLHSRQSFVHIENRVINMTDEERVRPRHYMTENRFDQKPFYLSHNYMDRFTKEDRQFVWDLLDKELDERLGYAELVEQLVAWDQGPVRN